MVTKWLISIKTAFLFFPYFALLITLPYILYHRKRNGIPLMRTVVFYSFVLYILCAYCLIILPLPDRAAVAALQSPFFQPLPLRDVYDYLSGLSQTVTSSPDTWYRIFINADLFQVLFNILMTVPFGLYMNYFFRCGAVKTVLFTLGLSLFFELTQLTGLYGLYPRPYRLADVSDLITNTLGGFLGYLLARRLSRLFSSEDMGMILYRHNQQVSLRRRLAAAIIDGCLVGGAAFGFVWLFMPQALMDCTWSYRAGFILLLVLSLFIFLYFGILEWLLGGRSAGKLLMKIRLVDSETLNRPKLWQFLVRYGIFYGLALPTPILSLLMLVAGKRSGSPGANAFATGSGVILLLMFAAFCVLIIARTAARGHLLPHSYFSRTKDVPLHPPCTEGCAENTERKDDLPQ